VPDSNVPAVEVKGLSKSFGSLRVLNEINLVVPSGTTLCILGPSGSGKSTLLRCINFLETPDAGEVFLRGQRIGFKNGSRQGEKDLWSTRARMGMVFQHFNLWPHLTVLGNVIESPVHVLGKAKDASVEKAKALLAKVGVADKMHVYPHTLSGGQKQRVAIARALAMEPEVLLFDEPTSALDPEIVGEVLGVMRQLVSDGMTMIVVTHEMGFAREAADTIVFMDAGNVVEVAPPEEFFTAPRTDRARQFLQRYMR
jgi:polar amino acid transport system ATP-binding protein